MCQILGPNRFRSCRSGIWGLGVVDKEGVRARPRRKGKNTPYAFTGSRVPVGASLSASCSSR